MSEKGCSTNGSHHQPFKQLFPEMFSIELVAEFIKHFRLELTAGDPFKRLISFPLVLRGEVLFVQLCHAAWRLQSSSLINDEQRAIGHRPYLLQIIF